MNTGVQNVDLCQPNQIFATRDARDIDRMCQIVGGKLDTRMGINPQAQRAQRLWGESFRQAATRPAAEAAG